jgi:light-regulated signal transduction histidine kinase (bacteriophytochrome)
MQPLKNDVHSLILNCQSEPIHLCGAIQPHGFLVAFNRNLNTVEFVSENVSDFIGVEPDIFSAMQPAEVVNVLKSAGSVTSFISGDMEIFEVEDIRDLSLSTTSETALRKKLLGAIELLSRADDPDQADDMPEFFQALAKSIQELCLYDRVMVYRFEADWSGTVLGESIVSKSYESFLNLRFPADDIPVQARELYRLSAVRYIPDVGFTPQALLSSRSENRSENLDLSKSLLRSVSPLHLEYLRNMKVAGSMSFSLIIKGKLWGLVACHNELARKVEPNIRTVCITLCRLASHLIEMRLAAHTDNEKAQSRTRQLNLLNDLGSFNEFARAFDLNSDLQLALFDAAGIVLIEPGMVRKAGTVPVEHDLQLIFNYLSNLDSDEVIVTNELYEMIGGLSQGSKNAAAGMLAFKISSAPIVWLMTFRPEVVSEINWAGEPVKIIDEEQPTLHPRRSFSLWKQTVAGKSTPWTSQQVESAMVLANYYRQRAADEARFAAALEAAPQIMIVVDGKGVVRYHNSSALKLLELTDPASLRGLPIDKILPNAADTYTIKTGSGRELPVRIENSPLNTAEGLFSLYSITDISERLAAEEERVRLTNALQDSNQKMEQFVDTIAHDLRAPLLSIGNLAKWIENDLGDSLSGAPKENLQTLRSRATGMRDQLSSLLNYSKAGTAHATVERVETSKLVESIVQSIDATKDFRIETRGLPVFDTVAAPLEHVLFNLIENACKYSGRPGTTIKIACEDAGEFFQFSVADEGRGIPVEYQQEIFYPLRSLASADEKGHGMGLAFVKRIVEQSGGTVRINSEPGKGAEFTFLWKKQWRD